MTTLKPNELAALCGGFEPSNLVDVYAQWQMQWLLDQLQRDQGSELLRHLVHGHAD